MKKKRSIEFILSSGKIVSVNATYGARLVYKFSKPIATIYKTAEAKKSEKYMIDQLEKINFKERAPWIFEKGMMFSMTVNLILKSSILARDLDNTLKLIQDSLFGGCLGINDSHVVEIHAYKTICPEISEEKVCISLSESTSELRFDKLESKPVPESICIFGTQIEKKELSEILSKSRRVVTEDEENSDCHIYFMTPTTDLLMIMKDLQEIKDNSIGNLILIDPDKVCSKETEAIRGLVGPSLSLQIVTGNWREDILNCFGKVPRKKTVKIDPSEEQ